MSDRNHDRAPGQASLHISMSEEMLGALKEEATGNLSAYVRDILASRRLLPPCAEDGALTIARTEKEWVATFRGWMVENYGKPADLPQEERDRWHERFGMFAFFMAEQYED